MELSVNHIVSELLLHNNCVVIPGFGGFVANPIAAKIDYSRGIISPPSKALTFNTSLTNNDGLVVTELAKKSQLDYENALEVVSSFAKKSTELIKNGERVLFPNVGFLFLNSAGKIAFEQDRFFNLLLSSFGLGSVEFVSEQELEEKLENVVPATKPVLENEKVVNTKLSSEKIEEDTPIVKLPKQHIEDESPRSSGIKKLLRYAAVAALTPIAFYSFWIPMNTDVLQSGIVYKEDFNPFKSKSEDVYFKSNLKDVDPLLVDPYESLVERTQHLPEDVAVYSFGLTEDIFVPVRIRSDKAVQELNENTSNNISTKIAKSSKAYYLIVGAFGEKSNAEGLVQKLKNQGFEEAHIVDKNKGLYRVAAIQNESRKSAKITLESLKNQGLSSWILSK
jgi:hypothetical protein